MPTIEITQEAYDALESSKFETASDAILAAMPKKKAKFDPLQGVPNAVNFASWSDWVHFRREKRKALSARAAGMQIKMLSEYPYQIQEQIINSSIQNDYQGLFAPKGGSNGQNQPARQSRADRSTSATQQLLAYADALENGDTIVREDESALRGPVGVPAGRSIGRSGEPISDFQLVVEEDGTVDDRRFCGRDGPL